VQAALDTSVLLADGSAGSRDACVLFVVHRAADGWLALDVAGSEIARVAPGEAWMGPPIRILRGGPEYADRTFSLYALDADPRSFGGLRVPAPCALRFGFGGDLEAIVRAARAEASARVLLFRGLSVIARRSRSIPEAWRAARGSPELVFATPQSEIARAVLRSSTARGTSRVAGAREASLPHGCAASRRLGGIASAPPTSRSGTSRSRGATPDSARGRRG
jgi:hypothetical protein